MTTTLVAPAVGDQPVAAEDGIEDIEGETEQVLEESGQFAKKVWMVWAPLAPECWRNSRNERVRRGMQNDRPNEWHWV